MAMRYFGEHRGISGGACTFRIHLEDLVGLPFGPWGLMKRFLLQS